MRYQSGVDPARSDFFASPTKGQSLGLSKTVGYKQLVMTRKTGSVTVIRVGEDDEITRHDRGALMKQLMKRMLPVGTRPVGTRLPTESVRFRS